MISVPLICVQPSRQEPLEEWPHLGESVLGSTFGEQICLTCHFLRQHSDHNDNDVLSCHLHQGLIGHTEQLTRGCLNWCQDMNRQRQESAQGTSTRISADEVQGDARD